MPYKGDTADVEVARIAARQHGVVSAKQLQAAGLERMAVSERSRKGRLHRVHHGVYAVGHRALSLHGRFMAAVLACGKGAVVSHSSAAVLWELLYPLDGPVHVSIPATSGRKSRRGIAHHRCPALQTPREPSPSPSSLPIRGGRGRRLTTAALTTHRHRIPVTTVSRTIEDLCAMQLLPPHLTRRAIRQAELKGYHLEGIESDRTRSDLESLFLSLIRPHRDRIPPPEVNPKLGRYEVDFLWRTQRLVVEVDSFAYHRGSVAFHADHRRDLDLRSAGYAVLRFDDLQLEAEPERVIRDVERELKQSR